MMTELAFGDDVRLSYWHLEPEAMEGLRAAVATAPPMVGGCVMVTAAADGDHSPNSLHYQGRAWDLRYTGIRPGGVDVKITPQNATRTGAIQRETAEAWARRIRKHVPGWQVVVEATHLHLERDWEMT